MIYGPNLFWWGVFQGDRTDDGFEVVDVFTVDCCGDGRGCSVALGRCRRFELTEGGVFESVADLITSGASPNDIGAISAERLAASRPHVEGPLRVGAVPFARLLVGGTD